jgi:hypothetical protein
MKTGTMSFAILATMAFSTPIVAHETLGIDPRTPAVSNGANKAADGKKSATEQRVQAQPVGHSGGTDSKGCHTDHSTGDYHCHKPK